MLSTIVLPFVRSHAFYALPISHKIFSFGAVKTGENTLFGFREKMNERKEGR